jgi:hypothetical protein
MVQQPMIQSERKCCHKCCQEVTKNIAKTRKHCFMILNLLRYFLSHFRKHFFSTVPAIVTSPLFYSCVLFQINGNLHGYNKYLYTNTDHHGEQFWKQTQVNCSIMLWQKCFGGSAFKIMIDVELNMLCFATVKISCTYTSSLYQYHILHYCMNSLHKSYV